MGAVSLAVARWAANCRDSVFKSISGWAYLGFFNHLHLIAAFASCLLVYLSFCETTVVVVFKSDKNWLERNRCSQCSGTVRVYGPISYIYIYMLAALKQQIALSFPNHLFLLWFLLFTYFLSFLIIHLLSKSDIQCNEWFCKDNPFWADMSFFDCHWLMTLLSCYLF